MRCLVLGIAATLSCGAPQYVQSASIAAGVEGASVFVGGDKRGATSADGTLGISVKGLAGDRFRVEIECPPGYRAPAPKEQVLVVMPGVVGGRPELRFRCRPALRTAIVRVRAENGADLPVRHLGRELGRTDASGTANVTLEVPVGDTFELALDTTNAPLLHPQNPTASFEMLDETPDARNDTFAFDQRFTVEVPKLKAPRAYVPRRLEKTEQ